MAQYLRPDADIADGTFTGNDAGTDLWTYIDESTADDNDYIKSSPNSNTYCDIRLSDPSTPDSGTCTVRFRYRMEKTNKTLTLTVTLYETSTSRGSKQITTLTDAWTADSFTFNHGDISDWTDLWLRFDISNNGGAGQFGYVSWAEVEVPSGAGTTYYQSLPATAVGTAGIARVTTWGKALDATAIGTAGLSTVTTWYRTLEATAIANAAFVRKTSKYLDATAIGTAGMTRVTTWYRTLTATALGLAELATAKLKLQALDATAIGVAGITPLQIASQSLPATAIGVAGITPAPTFVETLAATAIGVAGLLKQVSITLAATATGLAGFSRTTSKYLVATAIGVAGNTPILTALQQLDATALGIAGLATQFIEGGEEEGPQWGQWCKPIHRGVRGALRFLLQ